MEAFHLKLKVGSHEFEATGEPEAVEKQLAVWRDLIASPASTAPVMPSPLPAPPAATPPNPLASAVANGTDYTKLFRHDGRVVSLTVLPNGNQREADALLVLMLGQSLLNGTDQVTGQTLNDGMRLSGLAVERVDRSWGSYLDSHVLRSGVRRGVKYRLTHPGLAKAKEIAGELLAMVP